MNQQQKIQNPEMQIPKTPQMNDRDYLNDMLTTEKYLGVSYTFALHEASYDQLFNDLSSIAQETNQCQHELFNLMFRKGFYSFEAAEPQKLSQSYQQFSGYSNQFPYQ